MSSATHMSDLNLLTQDSYFDEILKVDGQIKPIWIILVDGDPDKNPYYMKNIYQYLYNNPVERNIASFSQKLTGITLPIDKYGSHLNSQSQVDDSELAMRNFHYADEALCTL
ncbi:unnamed protein product [Rhizophagus irregularis]|nr:unnamed protein product [Rhizophagus irregularis]